MGVGLSSVPALSGLFLWVWMVLVLDTDLLRDKANAKDAEGAQRGAMTFLARNWIGQDHAPLGISMGLIG